MVPNIEIIIPYYSTQHCDLLVRRIFYNNTEKGDLHKTDRKMNPLDYVTLILSLCQLINQINKHDALA
jgi:hypothetical protein